MAELTIAREETSVYLKNTWTLEYNLGKGYICFDSYIPMSSVRQDYREIKKHISGNIMSLKEKLLEADSSLLVKEKLEINFIGSYFDRDEINFFFLIFRDLFNSFFNVVESNIIF